LAQAGLEAFGCCSTSRSLRVAMGAALGCASPPDRDAGCLPWPSRRPAPEPGGAVARLGGPEQAHMAELRFSPDLSLLALSAEAKAGTTASGYGGDATGARPWWGGILLGAWIANEGADLFCGRSVLELGCGAAPLPAMAAAHKGAAKALATDGCPAAVRAAAAVLSRNAALPSTCAVGRQAWEESPKHGARAWDVVIFADVVYSEEGADLLAKAVDLHVAGDGWVLGAVGLLRFGSADIFDKMRRLGFAAVEVPVSPDVLARAEAAAAALAGANATDLGGGSGAGAMDGRCKLVRWVRCSAGGPLWDGRDEAGSLERHARDFLHQRESAVTYAEGWEPTE